MPDCDYCDESFPDESSYLEHLETAHRGELGPIDRRRVGVDDGDESDGSNLALYAVGFGIVALLGALVAYVLVTGVLGDDLGEEGPPPDPPGFDLGPPGEDEVHQPYDLHSTHYHGEITVIVDGERIDFRQPEYQHPRTFPAFHFEQGQPQWHGHAEGITLEYALEATAFGVTDDAFYYDGSHYDASEAGASVTYEVNGESVDPETYVLESDDEIRVVAQRNESE